MGTYSLKKEFPEIGEIEYKVASTRDEIEQAMALVYKEYLMRAFILPKYYKSNLRTTLHHLVPGTTTFVGLKGKEVVITATIIPDSPLGIPMDMGYKDDVDKLRRLGRKVCEAGYLAIKSELFGRGFFSLFNFKKLDFIFTLFKLELQYSLFCKKFDDICIVTNPRYMIFKFLPFEVIGEVKYYGYDVASVKKKAAVPKRLDLRKVREELKKIEKNPLCQISYKPALYKIFFGDKIQPEFFQRKYNLNIEDLCYFFVQKSDILKKARQQERNYILPAYRLSENDYNRLLTGKLTKNSQDN